MTANNSAPLSFDALAERFTGFEHLLNTRKQKKKDDAEKKIQELQTQIDDLKSSLLLEKNNQAMAMKAMQAWLSSTIDDYAAKFSRPYEIKFEQLNKRADDIVLVTEALDKRISEELRGIPQMIDDRARELLTEITNFKTRFEDAQLAREEKEAALLVRIVEQDSRLKHQLEAERTVREAKLQMAVEDIAKESSFRLKGFELIRQQLQEEAGSLKTAIAKEEKARITSNAELAQAVKHYTAALQDSIKIVADT